MRRLIPLIVAMALLFSSAAMAEQATVTAEPVSFTRDEAEARALADDLQQRLGITILIGDECVGAISNDSFSVDGSAPAK